MSGKITDARVEEIMALKAKRQELIAKIEKENEAMEAIISSVSDKDQDLIESSSRDAKSRRKKGSSNLTLREQLQGHQDVVRRLQERLAKYDEELKTFGEQ